MWQVRLGASLVEKLQRFAAASFQNGENVALTDYGQGLADDNPQHLLKNGSGTQVPNRRLVSEQL